MPHTQHSGFLFFEVQFTTFCYQKPRAYQIKNKGKSAGFPTQENALLLIQTAVTRFAPYAGSSLVFNQFQCPLAEGDFVHIASRAAFAPVKANIYANILSHGRLMSTMTK